ncbi:MAG: PLP-dependent aminotransferase family protein [Chloroflexota bacterium]
MAWTFEPKSLLASPDGAPRYEQIATAIEAAIARGELRLGDRLPTVRALARQLDVSGASVAVAYSLLSRRGRVNAQVGRGTFVTAPSADDDSRMRDDSHARGVPRPMPRRASENSGSLLAASWRRRALRFSSRLEALNPDALICTASWPDPSLLPTDIVTRAYARVAEQLRPEDLQYTGPEAHPELANAILPHLERDDIAIGPGDLVVMSSLRQVLTLTIQIAPEFLGTGDLAVAVEEPGHHMVYDTVESLGHRLIGVQVDAQGVIPESLEAALGNGANLVVLTPRALNPTGASWTPTRRAAIADVLATQPGALVLEDDYFAGVSEHRPGSLLSDARLGQRTIHARSFSKSMGPDLRTTTVAARGRLRAQLRDAKLVTDGWNSRISQRALAIALSDPETEAAFARARQAYAARRDAVTESLAARLPAGTVAPSPDGLNVWVNLPSSCNVQDVIHDAAELGVLVSSGEPFYLRPGQSNAVRLSISWVTTDEARRAGEILASAALAMEPVPVPIGV